MAIFKGMFVVLLAVLFSCIVGVISSNACKFNVRMKQVLHEEGFHRNITYGIVFDVEYSKNKGLFKDCTVGLDQPLPAGVFANPDELNDFKRIHQLNAILKNRINIELPAEESSPSNVFITGKVVDNKASLWLPVHARYHRAMPNGGMASNYIEFPRLLLQCPEAQLEACEGMGEEHSPSFKMLCNGSSQEMCSWKEIPFLMMTNPLVLEVPVGNLNHSELVATATAVSVVVGSVYLLLAIHGYKMRAKPKQN